MADGPRFIPNTYSRLFTVSNAGGYLKSALEDIVASHPPQDTYASSALKGVWAGPTSLAYLFLNVALYYPKLPIAGKDAIHWAREYIRGDRGPLTLGSRSCGLINEKISFSAVRAVITKDLLHVKDAVSCIGPIANGKVDGDGDGSYDDELLYGRAGALYLLRMVRHWVPNSAPLVERSIVMISNRLMDAGPDWNWRGERYLGAVHGDLGIVTQLVVTSPPLAPRFESKLEQLLDAQLPGGNWPVSVEDQRSELVQFCHGAPGFVLSLLSLRPYYPALEARIDRAIQLGRECIWREGLLRKEPNICHGIFGNALALPQGSQRDHFLAMATPEKVAELKTADPTVYAPADYGDKVAALASYMPSAAWSWLVCGREDPRILLYNDI